MLALFNIRISTVKIMFKKVFTSINDFFDPKYVDTTPIPKQENNPDELIQKVKKTVLESGMFEHAKKNKKKKVIYYFIYLSEYLQLE
jgi:hypothetical protein